MAQKSQTPREPESAFARSLSAANEYPESLADLAYSRLREAIAEKVFLPGSRLVERDVAKYFNISRTPVRDALRRLESEGLLQQAPPRGFAIVRLDHQMITELYYTREILEGTTAALSAKFSSEAEIEILKDLLKQEQLYSKDVVQLYRINRQFHRAIYHSAHNRYLIRTLSILEDALMLLGPNTLVVAGRPEAAHREHAALVSAIEKRDAAKAEEIARAHIRGAYRARLAMVHELQPGEERVKRHTRKPSARA